LEDLYEILGVSRDASQDEIKRAYRRLVTRYHPDRNKGDKDAEEKFKKINAANDVLSDPGKRAHYDRFGTTEAYSSFGEGFEGFGGVGDLFGDIIGQFFNGASARTSPNSPRKGADLEMPVKVTLLEAAQGVARNVEIPRFEICKDCRGTGAKAGTSPEVCAMCKGRGRIQSRQRTFFGGEFLTESACPQCGGNGRIVREKCPSCDGLGQNKVKHKIEVKIPPGVETNLRLRISGEGNAGVNGGPSGDLFLTITVASHKEFERNGGDLHRRALISYPQAVLGAEISVETLTDGVENLLIPAGTKAGAIFKVKGKGMPHLRGPRGKGDLYVHMDLYVPKTVTDKERQLIAELGKEMRLPVNTTSEEGFFDRIKKKIFD
jgi:molecular chaperone DnaJ